MLRYITFGFGIAGVLLGLFACAPNPKAEESCNFVQNVYGQRISWKDQVPIPLMVHSNFPKEYLPALERAIKTWENSAGRRLFAITSTQYQDSASPAKDGQSVVYWLHNWEPEKPTEQARTSIYWVGNQIREADLRINDKNFDFYTDTSNTNKGVHLESLLIHELGHILGLKHIDGTDNNSVMATYLALQVKRENLSDIDKEALSCEYK